MHKHQVALNARDWKHKQKPQQSAYLAPNRDRKFLDLKKTKEKRTFSFIFSFFLFALAINLWYWALIGTWALVTQNLKCYGLGVVGTFAHTIGPLVESRWK